MSQPAAAEPQPKPKPRRPVWEKLLVRGGILVLLVIVGVEAAARHYHGESLTRMETAVRSSRQQSETILMDRQGLVGIPSGWYFETSNKGASDEILTWKWPSPLKTYLLQVRLDDDGKVQEFGTHGDLEPIVQAVAPPTPDVSFMTVPPGTVVAQVPSESGLVLAREVVRQAFLMAAQEQFQLATPDAFERMEIPQGPSVTKGPFEINLVAPNRLRLSVQVSRATPDGPRAIYAEECTVPPAQQVVTLTTLAERALRTVFPKILQAEGFSPGPARNSEPASPVSQLVMDLQANPDPISQFAALRLLHQQAIREVESPDVYIAIARGYTALGSDCELNWSLMHKVFKARALIWAERAVHIWPEQPDVWLARAHVRAICGLPDQALGDLDKYETTAGTTNDPTAATLRQFCRWDAKSLAAKTQESDPYASHLYLRMLEQSGNSSGWLEVSEKISRSQPTSWRVHALRATAQPLGVRHDTAATGLARLAATLPVLMEGCIDLPEAVRQVLDARREAQQPPDGLDRLLQNAQFPKESDWRDQLVEALLKAPVPQNVVEPLPWAVLGRVIDDFQFQQALSLLEFHRLMLAVETAETINELRPLVRNHPLAGLLDCFDTNVDRSRKAGEDLQPVLEKFEFSNTALMAHWLVPYSPQLDVVRKRVMEQRDNVTPDLLAWWVGLPDQGRGEALDVLKIMQPENPVVGAAVATIEWKSIEAEAQTWERRYVDEPAVMKAFTEQYLKAKRWTDARRTAERFASLQPEFASYWMLADVCRQTADWDGRQQALRTILELPAQGLEHAQAHNALAYDLMDRQDWAAARPHAEAAAGSYSAWGLTCAAECYEGLKLWKRAEQMMQACAQRYENSTAEWYRWCLRTGHGDVARARQLAWQKFERPSLESEELQWSEQAVYHWMEGNRQQAYQLLLDCCERSEDGYYDMLAALFADQMGDAAGRDARLADLAAQVDDTMYTALARMILKTRGSSGIAFTDAELEWFATRNYSIGGPSNGQYLIAHALRMSGDSRSGEWLRQCASSPRREKFLVILAGWELVQAGEPPPSRKGTELPEPQNRAFERLIETLSPASQNPRDERLRGLHDAVAAAPEFLTPLNALGDFAFANSEFEVAEEAFTKLVAQAPHLSTFPAMLGRVYEAQNQPAKAIATYEAGLKLDLNSQRLHNNLAWLFLGIANDDFRDVARGLEHGRQSLEAGADTPVSEVALRAVMAAAEGNFESAISLQQKAFDLAPQNDKHIMQQRLEAFQKQQAYRRAPIHAPLLTVLPEDDAWVTFDTVLKVSQHAYWDGVATGRDTKPVEYTGTITVRSVGRIAADNLRCLEIELAGDNQYLHPWIYRLIVPEAAFGLHQSPIESVVCWWSGLPDGPVLPMADLSDDPELAFILRGAVHSTSFIPSRRPIRTPKGPYNAEIVSGAAHQGLGLFSHRLSTTVYRNAEIPFGAVMVTAEHYGDEIVRASLTLRDFGNNATAAWPDLVP